MTPAKKTPAKRGKDVTVISLQSPSWASEVTKAIAFGKVVAVLTALTRVGKVVRAVPDGDTIRFTARRG